MHGELLTLGDYVVVIRRQKWLILAFALVVGAAGYAYAAHKHTTYVATVPVATTYVQPPSVSGVASGNTPNSTVNARFLANQAAFARSSAVLVGAANLAAGTESGITASSYANKSSVTPSSDADILDFSVTSSDRTVARKLATYYAAAYVAARRAAIDRQYAPLIASVTKTKDRLQETIQSPSATPQVIRSLRPELNLSIRNLAALTNFIQQVDESVQVEENPSAPAASRVSPLKYGIAGFITGLVIGLIAAFVRDALDSRVRSSRQVADGLELPILASIPTPPRNMRRSNQLVTLAGDDAQAEPFRMLAARLKLISPTRTVRIILITSALDGEGKSTSAANLAVALAELGETVTLVDSDLVRPTAARFFGVGDQVGLADVIAGRSEISDASASIDLQGKTGTLSVVPPGRHAGEPAALLSSPALSDTLSALASTSRYVILDSPPMLSISHGTVLGALADAVLVVARADQLTTQVAAELKQSLDAIPAMKVGVILTAADKVGPHGYGYKYGYYAADLGLVAQAGANGHSSAPAYPRHIPTEHPADISAQDDVNPIPKIPAD